MAFNKMILAYGTARKFAPAPIDGGEGTACPAPTGDVSSVNLPDAEPLPGFPVPGTDEEEKYEIHPDEFRSSDGKILPDGVYLVRKKEAVRICGYLRPIAVTRNKDGGDYGLVVEFVDLEGKKRERSVAMETVMKGNGLASDLSANGLWVNLHKSGTNPVNFYLNYYPKEGLPREVTVDRGGLVGYECFLWDGGAIRAKHCKTPVRLSAKGKAPKLNRRGSLEDWQKKNAEFCAHSTRISFAVALAFVPPLLPILGGTNCTFGLTGASGMGKSSAMAASVSVWGDKSFMKGAKSTGNGAEAAFQQYHCFPCYFDELTEANAAMLEAVTYGNGNGRGKNRMKKDGSLEESEPWSNYALVAGEAALEELRRILNKGRGEGIKTGEVVRLLEIPFCPGTADGWGGFETLPEGLKDDDTRRREWIRERASDISSYGHAGIAFVRKLIEEIDCIGIEAFRKNARESINAFRSAACEGMELDDQHLRALEAFATVAYAGELAISYGVLTWETGRASEAALACFKAWVDTAPTITRRGKDFASRLIEDASTRRVNYLRFDYTNPLDTGEEPVGVAAKGAVGTLILNASKEGVLSLFSAAQFAQLVLVLGGGLNVNEARKALIDNAMLLRVGNESGFPGRCKVQSEKPPFRIHKGDRIYIVRVGDESEAEEAADMIKKSTKH